MLLISLWCLILTEIFIFSNVQWNMAHIVKQIVPFLQTIQIDPANKFCEFIKWFKILIISHHSLGDIAVQKKTQAI